MAVGVTNGQTFHSDFRLQPPIHQREEREVNRHLNSHRWRRTRSHAGAVVQDLERTLISDLDGTLIPPGIAAYPPD